MSDPLAEIRAALCDCGGTGPQSRGHWGSCYSQRPNATRALAAAHDALSSLRAERAELIDLLVELATDRFETDVYADDYGGPVLDSYATTFGAGVLRRLAALGRVEILDNCGLRVIARRKE